MNQYMSGALLRDQAKNKLNGKYATAIRMFLLGQLTLMLLDYLIQSLVLKYHLNTGFSGLIITIILSLLLSIFAGVLEIGYAYFYLNAFCGEPYRVSDLLYGFLHQPSKSISIAAFFSVLAFISRYPARFLLQTAIWEKNSTYLWYSLLYLGATSVVYLYLWLRFHLCIYLLLDYPDKSFGDLMKLSSKLMQGNMLRLFTLVLSFLPMFILGILSFGVGILWVVPFYTMSQVCFFMNLMNPENN